MEKEKYTIKEFKGTLTRVFKNTTDNHYIYFDGREATNDYLRASWHYYIDNEYIRVETVELEQETFMKGYITEKGKNWIKL